MSQSSNFRRGFFVALVGLSLGLALASGLLALMERLGARDGLQQLASYAGGTDGSSPLNRGSLDTATTTQVTGIASDLPASNVQAARRVSLLDGQGFDSIPLGGALLPEPSAAFAVGSFAAATASEQRPQLFIPKIEDAGPVALEVNGRALGSNEGFDLGTTELGSGAARGLDGQELALAGDGDLVSLTVGQGANEGLGIGALVEKLESQDPMLAPVSPNAAAKGEPDNRQIADASLTAFRSTATLKTLPSGRSMSWVTPGLAMTNQHNPLYLDQRGFCALTFDDGPDRIKDNRIMDILRSEGVPATFFVLGNKLKGAEATIARMLAEGHEVGNHSWSHPQLTKLGYDKAASQVERTSQALKKLGAQVRVFRPPYGAQNKSVRAIGDSLGMRMLLWDVDSLDWKLRRGASIRNEIDRTAYRGSVVLMHSHVAGTVEALPQIIADLRAKGCVFVTASQWFDGLNGYGQPLPEQTERVANKPRSAPATAAPAAPSAPTTSYQWNPSPTPVYPSAPAQPSNEPIYIY